MGSIASKTVFASTLAKWRKNYKIWSGEYDSIKRVVLNKSRPKTIEGMLIDRDVKDVTETMLQLANPPQGKTLQCLFSSVLETCGEPDGESIEVHGTDINGNDYSILYDHMCMTVPLPLTGIVRKAPGVLMVVVKRNGYLAGDISRVARRWCMYGGQEQFLKVIDYILRDAIYENDSLYSSLLLGEQENDILVEAVFSDLTSCDVEIANLKKR